MQSTRIKISSIVESQIPDFVRSEFPLVEQLLKEYYSSLDSVGLPYDLLSNIDQYVKVENITDTVESTTLSTDVSILEDEIEVSSTKGFPKTYGLIKIDDEIILYKSKTDTSFLECSRGFSGITKYSSNDIEGLEFSTSEESGHTSGSEVQNLSGLILKQFFGKLKKQFLPGFEGRELYEGLRESTFVKQSQDFYNSKGTIQSFEILFRCLYGEDVTVTLPKENLIKPSESTYEITRNFVVTAVQGNPEDLLNQTIFQDEYEFLRKSFGIVSNVEKVIRDSQVFYNLQVDATENNPYQNLKIHSNTNTTTKSFASSGKITVDSTLSFENSGEIVVSFDNQTYTVTYTDKTINQFLNCTGIDVDIPTGASVSINSFAYGFSPTGEEIRFRFNGVISGINLADGSQYYNPNDVGRLLSLGYDATTALENNWIINNSVKCAVKSFKSLGNNRYSIETFDPHNIQSGDRVEVEYISTTFGNSLFEVEELNATVVSSNPKTTIQVQTSLEVKEFRFIKRKINTIEPIVGTASADGFMSDILNVYKDFDSDDIYVTSSSLPSYFTNANDIQDFKFDLSGSFPEVPVGYASTTNLKFGNTEHGLISGDLIVYRSNNETPLLGISEGGYFVNQVDDFTINIARSRADLFNKKYVSIANTTIVNEEYFQLQKFDKEIPTVDSQRLIRKISKPKNSDQVFNTLPGTTGILVNGVETLNYKSQDFVYYGSLERIDVISSNSELDIINPPVLGISTATGQSDNAKGTCGIEGSLSRIDIIEPGFDYTDTPVITISGGDGIGANASAQLIEYDYSVSFNSSSTNPLLNLSTNQIGFSTYHRFKSGEYVVYETSGSLAIGGLVNNAKYYVGVLDDFRIRLHKSEDDALNGINLVGISSYGLGTHSFRSVKKKKKIVSIKILNSGSGYKNKEIKADYTGINTANNTVNVFQHPYQSGETIFYYGGDTNISGLSTGKYIVTRVDDKSFRLSEIGFGNTSPNFFYETKQYVNFTSQGLGLHEFNYEKISVSINGPLGTASSLPGNEAEIQPVFRGKLSSVSLSESGVGYGSSDVINFNKQPNITLTSGSGALASPVISNGKISSVLVYQKGEGYNSPPDIRISGSGIGALLTPIVKDGQLSEIKVINSGSGYSKTDTKVEILNPVSQINLISYPKSRNINLYARLEQSNFSSDDNVVYRGLNSQFGLQFTHLYTPKLLRERLYTSNAENTLFRTEIENDNVNNSVKYHSPIMGWAYDGNPIYGPYGFDSLTNRNVRRIKSSYKQIEVEPLDRPSKKVYPIGYFVEDYVYNIENGDLDENNGRFCVTPEFPLGVYAYFMTLDDDINDPKPSFPYIIGESYHSNPIDFNFKSTSTQNNFDFTKNIVRNTNLYNSLSFNSKYEHFLNISKLNLQNSTVNSTNDDGIDSLNIISPGENYKVGDKITFESEELPIVKALAEVSTLSGREITQIQNESIKIKDSNLYPYKNRTNFVAFSTTPHGLKTGDQVSIDSLNRESLDFQSTFKVTVNTPNELILSTAVGLASITGIATYFNVVGNLKYPSIRENDILTLNSEKVKVLNVDELSSRIKVLREQDSTVSSAHSSYTKIVENPRKLFVDLPKEVSNENFSLDREIYFNPSESLGIGTSASTITFSNPGFGITSITIPERSIFIENHNLESGDLIQYKTNSGDPILVSIDGTNDIVSLPEKQNLHVIKFSENLIGISTNKIAIANDGTYAGVGSTAELLYFNGPGTEIYHSFTTKNSNSLIGDINLYKTTVSTAVTHSLKINDVIVMDAKPATEKTFVVKYNDFNRRLIIDPKDFIDDDVNFEENLITIENHGYFDGDKVIHNSPLPIGGLGDEQMYYISVFNKDAIRFHNSFYDATNKINEVEITNQFSGTLSQINPRLNVIKDNNIIFDLSDPSLSESGQGTQGTTVSSFEFRLYLDENLTDELISISSNNQQLQILGISNITYTGDVGVTSDAKVQFTVDSIAQDRIYYDLVPIGTKKIKTEIIKDLEVQNNNQILFENSVLSGSKKIVGITTNTFDVYNSNEEFISLYSVPNDGSFSYTTNSKNEFGPINETRLISRGYGYKSLPYISEIETSSGKGALLIPKSDNIGNIISAKIRDIGYNYSPDPTLKPLVKFATKYRVEPLTNIGSIKVLTPGLNYNTSPDVILVDSFTKEPVEDLILDYKLGDEFVSIIQNTRGIYNLDPTVIVFNNSNGVGISSISYNNFNNIVTVELVSSFSTLSQFPFKVGDEVLVEGVNTIEGIQSGQFTGYNSEDYKYSTFKIIEIDPALGGFGAFIRYSMLDYLEGSEVPGTWDSAQTGSVVNVNALPTFEVTLSKNKFEFSEKVTNGEIVGTVNDWDPNNEFLTAELDIDFSVGDLIFGESSKSQAFVQEIFKYETFYEVDSSSVVIEGWKDQIGFLNTQEQKIQDSDYYQNFSYVLESRVQFETWDNDVNNLNHTLGFKKFATYVFDSDIDNVGIQTATGSLDATVDLSRVIDLECIVDFDLVSENFFYVNNILNSDEIKFNSVLLLDYAESRGNRVLIIDDISDEFNSQISQTFVTSFNI